MTPMSAEASSPTTPGGVAGRDVDGLDPSQMALAWCNSRPFVTSSIFGATSIPQLETALGAADMILDQAVMDDITTAHKAHPMPY